jgi:competence protein ComEC
MAIMAGAVFALIRFFLAAIPPLALTQPIKKWAAAGGAAGAILYYTISGGSAATLRSAIMMVVIFLAVMLGRPAIAMRNVAIAALVILALFPESLLDAGFQMSFAAVSALVAAYEAARRLMARRNLAPGSIMRAVLFLGGILFSTVIAGLAVTPLSIYHFHAMQHYAPLANLAAVPICNLVVMPAALATLVALPFGLEAAPLWIMGWGLDAMGMVARYVAGLPGAVTRIPQVPDMAFALILAGGLWLVLWQQRWRLAGIPLIVACFAASPNAERPDLIVGREGALVAVRDSSGKLAAHSDRPSTFELARWLEHDGDGRDPKAVRKTAAFRCDPLGCSTITGGVPLAVSRHPASIADDCDRAKILIVNGARPRACDAPILILDRADLKMSGTVALHRLPNGTYEKRSVADARGERPWSSSHDRAESRSPLASAPPRMEEKPSPRPSASTSDGNRSAAPTTASMTEALADPDELRPDVDEDVP